MRQEEWEEKVMAGCLAIVAEGEAERLRAQREVRRLCDQTRVWLVEQCFWAYPPPMVEEGAGSLELYSRYKYGSKGRESRRWFRDKARRMAAKYMVKTYLVLKSARDKG